MAVALSEAASAATMGEVPVGCVIAEEGKIIGRAGNAPIAECDPSAHAEIRAMREAGRVRSNYRLTGCDLFVTLEPCVMCAGAMVHARFRRVVYGASDPKTGAAGSVFNILGSTRHNHQIEVVGGVCAEQCSDQLADFFRQRRKQQGS